MKSQDSPPAGKPNVSAVVKTSAAKPMAVADVKVGASTTDELEVLPPAKPAKKLKPSETKELEQLEDEIAEGFDSFWDVVKAFGAIHDKLLYREYGTFADYCVQRWDFNRDYGQRLVRANGIYQSLEAKFKDTEIPLPTNESQVRPLSKVEQNDWEEAWEAAAKQADGKPITQAIVVEAAQPFLKPTPKKKAGRKPKKPAVVKVAELRPLLDELETALKGASGKVQKLLKQITALLPKEPPPVEPKVKAAKNTRTPKGKK